MISYRTVKKNDFLNIIRQVSKILFPFITFPYITRVLQVENYGKVGWCTSIIGYFVLLASLGIYDYAIREGARVRENRIKINVFCNEIFSINLIATLLSYLLFIIFILLYPMTKDCKELLVIQSMTILLTALGVEWIYVIYEDYLYVTIRTLGIQILSIILIFIFIKNASDYKKYIIITTVSSIIGFLFNFIYSRKYLTLHFTSNLKIEKHIRPILYLFINSALISVYVNSDITMLGIIKTNTQVGLYEVSVKIYTIIKTIISAVVVVAVPRLSFYLGEKNNRKFEKLALNVFKSMIIMIFPAMVGLYMISNNIVKIIVGQDYLESVLSLKILSIAGLFSLLASFFINAILIPYKKEKTVLIATFISAIFNIGLNFIFIPIWGLNGAAITTLIAEIIVTIIGFLNSRDIFPLKDCQRTFIAAVLGCILIIGMCTIISIFQFSIIYDTIFKIIVSMLLYFLTQLSINTKFLKLLILKA